MEKAMILHPDEISRIKSALRLRVEACEENNETIEAKKWEAILIKIGIVEQYGGYLKIKA